MSWFTNIFGEADDWRLVKVWEVDYCSRLKPGHPEYSFTNLDANVTDHQYSYYLYENQHSDRKIDVIDTQGGDIDINKEEKDSFIFRNKEYRSIIRPWLDGQYNPEIPSYESIKAKEFKDNLAGKVT